TDANGTPVSGKASATVTLTAAPVVPVAPPPSVSIVGIPPVTVAAPAAAGGGGGGGGGGSSAAPSSQVAAARSAPQNRIAEVLPARLPSTGSGGAEGSGLWLTAGAGVLAGGLVLGLAAVARRRRSA